MTSRNRERLNRIQRTLERLTSKKSKSTSREAPEDMGTKTSTHVDGSAGLTKTEQNLLREWRELSPSQQQKVLALVRQLRFRD